MGLFDFWRKRRGGVERAGFFDRPSANAKDRYLANLAGSEGIKALFVSGFERDERLAPEKMIHARYVGRLGRDGVVEFSAIDREGASRWALARAALRRVAEVGGTETEVIPLKEGGIIVLSADVNVEAEAGLWGKIKGVVESFIQRYVTRSRKVEEAIGEVERRRHEEHPELPAEEPVVPGYSIGNLFQGRYYDTVTDPKTGQKKMILFNERSFAIEIRGIDSETLRDIADAVRTAFNQNSVLVKDDVQGSVYLLRKKG